MRSIQEQCSLTECLHLYKNSEGTNARGVSGIGCGEQLLSVQVRVCLCFRGVHWQRGMGLKPTMAIRTTFQWEVDTSK